MGDEVWYASYGSNMWWARFRCYLEGGVPPGATRTHEHTGARDASPPSDSRAVRLPHQMYFAGAAAGWDGGGVSFLDHGQVDGDARAWSRAWRITREQFDDVVAQENGLDPGELAVDLTGMAPGGTCDLNDRWYGRLVLVDMVDGLPLVTFTSPRPLDPDRLNAPAGTYLRTLAAGLAECAVLPTSGPDMPDVGAYLAAAPGAAGHWTPSDIDALL